MGLQWIGCVSSPDRRFRLRKTTTSGCRIDCYCLNGQIRTRIELRELGLDQSVAAAPRATRRYLGVAWHARRAHASYSRRSPEKTRDKGAAGSFQLGIAQPLSAAELDSDRAVLYHSRSGHSPPFRVGERAGRPFNASRRRRQITCEAARRIHGRPATTPHPKSEDEVLLGVRRCLWQRRERRSLDAAAARGARRSHLERSFTTWTETVAATASFDTNS